MYHKLETQQHAKVVASQQSEQVAKLARDMEVSQEAILRHIRRLQHAELETTTLPGGIGGVRLGRIEIPQSTAGTVRGDGWRASTIGGNKLPVERLVDGGAGTVRSVPEGRRRDVFHSVDGDGRDYEARIRDLEAEVARLRRQKEGK